VSDLTRREFSGFVGAAGMAVTAAVASPAIASSAPKVIIVGGGAGGATVARRLKAEASKVDVTLVEVARTYASPFLSEHFLGGFRSLNSLTHTYEGVVAGGINVIHERASGVDTARRSLTLHSGTVLPYDKLILSPGIDFRFDSIAGYGPDAMERVPHAWKNGSQNVLLRNQLLDMRDGGTVIMSIPRGAIRGGTAPYTRASMTAHYLKYHKPKSKLILLDGNRDFPQRPVFEAAWQEHYDGILEHRMSGADGEFGVSRIDANTLEIETIGGEREKSDVLSVIPKQRAGMIAHVAGCVDGNWCPVDPATFQSRTVQHVHVLGDAADAGAMPKTAFAANSQGRAVANHLAAELAGKKQFPARFRNTQWSLVATNNAIKMGASYVVGKEGVVQASNFESEAREPETVRQRNFDESLAWYETMTREMFATV